jgi:coenzyme F420-reducing hydrogenase beta subunit
LVDIKEKKDCCGCRACELICQQKAIKMKEDFKGFKYPVIDYSLCNKCGLCDDVCAFNDNYKNNGNNPKIYAVKNKDEEIRKTSTSGGMFVAISDCVLQNDGVVYGVGYGKKLYVRHSRAEEKEKRDTFKGSKYVQSDIGDTFLRVKKDVMERRQVLFTGTPCQVGALNNFLRNDYDNLLTVDIICHGTPSNKIWREYLDLVEKVNKNKVLNVNFRDKTMGWHSPKARINFEKARVKNDKIIGEQSFFQLYFSNSILMPACHNCHYSNYKRPSDITIADFWGIERSMAEYDDNKGISLVFINSTKGSSFFNNIKEKIEIRESSKENCEQINLLRPTPQNEISNKLWNDYEKKGIKYIMLKYTQYSCMRTLYRQVILKVKIHLYNLIHFGEKKVH